ncbi:MAG: hypothetical protein AAF408_19255, partial [Pseudomonadota bacterium]
MLNSVTSILDTAITGEGAAKGLANKGLANIVKPVPTDSDKTDQQTSTTKPLLVAFESALSELEHEANAPGTNGKYPEFPSEGVEGKAEKPSQSSDQTKPDQPPGAVDDPKAEDRNTKPNVTFDQTVPLLDPANSTNTVKSPIVETDLSQDPKHNAPSDPKVISKETSKPTVAETVLRSNSIFPGAESRQDRAPDIRNVTGSQQAVPKSDAVSDTTRPLSRPADPALLTPLAKTVPKSDAPVTSAEKVVMTSKPEDSAQVPQNATNLVVQKKPPAPADFAQAAPSVARPSDIKQARNDGPKDNVLSRPVSETVKGAGPQAPKKMAPGAQTVIGESALNARHSENSETPKPLARPAADIQTGPKFQTAPLGTETTPHTQVAKQPFVSPPVTSALASAKPREISTDRVDGALSVSTPSSGIDFVQSSRPGSPWFAQSTTVPQVTQQIAMAVQNTSSGNVEIFLEPRELGRVQLTLAT